VVLAVAGCAGTDPTAAEPGTTTSPGSPTAAEEVGQRIEVEVVAGRATGDTGRVPVPAGTTVTLVVRSDVVDEVHVHGYDLTSAVSPDRPAQVGFDATIPGVFEVELHDAGTVLLTLQVQ
jgi:heme/copper-type cytochrome/quinol oxidase subunit 2